MTDQLLDAPVHTIKPNAHRLRTGFDPEALQKLAGSVTQRGLIHQAIVMPEDDGRLTILAGEWRGRAIQPTGFSTIPVLVKDRVDDRAMTEMALIENVQREDLSVADEARVYDQLARNFGLSDDEIAQRVGKSRSTIANIRNLVRLPAPVLDLVGNDDTALRSRNGCKCGHLPQRFARALAPVAHLLPEKQLLAAAQKIAAPHHDGQYHDDPEDIIDELISSVTVELPHRDRCWDLAWLTTPMTITDAEGSLDVRDCKGCPHFIAAGRRCAYRRCFNAKIQLYAHHELERVAKNTGISTAAETESVTIISVDWSNEDKIKRWLSKPAEHLRLRPVTPEHRGDYHTQQILGSAFVLLATTDPAVLKGKEKDERVVRANESEAARARRLAAEERERAQRRKERSEARRARADVTWLVIHTIEALAPKMAISGGVLQFAADLTGNRLSHSWNDWPEMADVIAAHGKAEREARGKPAQLELLLRARLLRTKLLDDLHSFNPKELFNWPRALKKVEDLAEAFGLKLPKGWDTPPIQKTKANCWSCGCFASQDHLTQRDIKEGWGTTRRGQELLDVHCPDCGKKSAQKARKE